MVQTRRIRFCLVCPSHTRRETEETLRECNQTKWDTNEGRGTHWTNPEEPIADIEPVSEEEMRPRRLLHLHNRWKRELFHGKRELQDYVAKAKNAGGRTFTKEKHQAMDTPVA